MVRVPGRSLLAAALLTVPAGCNAGDPLGLAEGRADATVSDPPEATPTYSGQVAGNYRAAVSADGQRWIDLGPFNEITVALQSTGLSSVHGTQNVPVGTYEFVRLLMQAVEVTVAAGSAIEGSTLEANATVRVAPNDTVRVVRQILPLTVATGTLLRIRFDLNSEAWLTLESVQTGTAAREEVEERVSVQVLRG